AACPTTICQTVPSSLKMGYVRKNVAGDVPLPKPGRKDIRPLSPAEVTRFLDAVQGDRLFALYVVALDSGARQGELLALEWSDWDPASRELSITKTLVDKDGKGSPASPRPGRAGGRRRCRKRRQPPWKLTGRRAPGG